MKRNLLIIATTLVLVAASGLMLFRHKEKASPAAKRAVTMSGVEAHVHEVRSKADEYYAARPEQARPQYERIVAENRANADPKIQDIVAASRIRLGYIAAREKNFSEARKQFLTTAREYKGTGVRSPDFGGYRDQAEYQAAVCLMAAGKDSEAKQALLEFMRVRWDSPLVQGAYQRLQRMGADDQAAQDLLQADIAKQEARAKFENAVCGPKAISQLLSYLKRPAASYKEVAKLCGTSEKGTTVEGMRKGMKALGLMSYAFVVNRKDFANLPSPSIWLKEDHYLILLSTSPGRAKVYDPLWAGEREVGLPPPDDPDFQAPVITLSVPAFLETKSI